jgi:hypothetical protein
MEKESSVNFISHGHSYVRREQPTIHQNNKQHIMASADTPMSQQPLAAALVLAGQPATASAGAPPSHQHGPDARLAVRSPLNPDIFVFMDLPDNVHPKEMVEATSTARVALQVIQGNRKFFEYPLNSLGLFSLQVLAESTKKSTMPTEHRSRLIGMYGASQFLMSLEQIIRENRSIGVSFLKEEAAGILRHFGAWALHYSAECLKHSAYPYYPERAKRIGDKIEEVLVAAVEEKKREAERLAKAEHIRKEEQQRRAIEQEAAKIRREEKQEEARLQREAQDARAPQQQLPSPTAEAVPEPHVEPPVVPSPATSSVESPVVADNGPVVAASLAETSETTVVILDDDKTPAVAVQRDLEQSQEATHPSIVSDAALPAPDVLEPRAGEPPVQASNEAVVSVETSAVEHETS